MLLRNFLVEVLMTSFVFICRTSDDNMDISVLRKGRRLYANQDDIDKLKPVQVKKVPLVPQGPAKYEVEYNDGEPLICPWL